VLVFEITVSVVNGRNRVRGHGQGRGREGGHTRAQRIGRQGGGSSLKVTVPLGVPVAGLCAMTVVVKVIDWPNTEGLTDETRIVALRLFDGLASELRRVRVKIAVVVVNRGDRVRAHGQGRGVKVAWPALEGICGQGGCPIFEDDCALECQLLEPSRLPSGKSRLSERRISREATLWCISLVYGLDKRRTNIVAAIEVCHLRCRLP